MPCSSGPQVTATQAPVEQERSCLLISDMHFKSSLGLLLCYSLLLLARPGVAVEESCREQAADEADVCIGVLQLIELGFLTPEKICPELVSALKCVEDARASCAEAEWHLSIINAKDKIDGEMERRGCEVPATFPTPTSPSPTVCHELEHPDLISDSSRDPVASIPVLLTAQADPSPSPDCPQSQPNPRLEHCSLFAFSHLRPFGTSKLSTCLMPGPWYLVKQPDVLEVIVHNVVPNQSVVESITQIDRVTVVFPAHACHGNETKVYTASIDSGLPYTFTDNTTGNANDSLLLNVTTSRDRNNGSAILRSHSFNITISIRMHSGHFVVTIQAPEHLLEHRGLGLCHSGCPQHAEPVDVEAEQAAWCKDLLHNTVQACGSRPNILNGLAASGEQYLHACRFDVVKQQDYEMVALANMAVEDALLLGPVEPATEKPQTTGFRFFQKVLVDNSSSTAETPSQRDSPSSDSPSSDSPLTDDTLESQGSSSPPPELVSPVALLTLALTVLAVL